MDSKTKKVLLISSIIIFIIPAILTTYILYKATRIDNLQDFQFSSGKYHCEINILHEGNADAFKWNIGISKTNIKNSITENESNIEILYNFRETVYELSSEKSSLSLLMIYLVFILIVLTYVQKDTQIYKNENNKKTIQILVTLIIIFLVYKIITSSIELSGLYKDANYYFNLIS